MAEVPETFTETYGFHLDSGKDGVKIFDSAVDFENPIFSSSLLNLLAVGNLKKVYVASNGAQVAIGHVESLEEDRKIFDLPNTTIVGLSADNVYVYLVVDSALKRAKTDDLLQGKNDFEEVAKDVKDFKASPIYSNLTAVLQKDGTLLILGPTEPIHTLHKINAFNWTSDGASVATISRQTFAIHKYDGTLTFSHTDHSRAFDGLLSVSNDQWLLSNPSDDDTLYYLLKKEGSSAKVFEVPFAPAFGDLDRVPSMYSTSLHDWVEGKTLTLVSTALSTEISTLEYESDVAHLIAHANDTDRAELPMYDGEDTLPVGMGVDVTGTSRLVKEPCLGVEEANGVLPRLFCLNHKGFLVIWDMFDSVGIREERLSLERALTKPLVADIRSESSQSVPLKVDEAPSLSTEDTSDHPAPSSPEKENKEMPKPKPAAPPASPFRAAFDTQGSGTTGLGSSSLGSSSVKPSTTSSSGFGQSGFGQSGFGQSGFGQSGFGQSGFGQSGFGQSGFGQSGFGKSSSGNQPATSSSKSEVKSGFGSYASKNNAFAADRPSPFANKSSSGDIFGGSGAEIESSKPSIFGASSSDKPSIFGSTFSEKPSAFGTFSSSEKPSIFESSQSVKPFGSSSHKKSIFGDAPSATSSEPEGESEPAIGGASKPIFGSSKAESPFGQSSKADSSDSKPISSSIFGQSSQVKPFGSSTSSSTAFGQSSSPKPFGSFSTNDSPFAKLSGSKESVNRDDNNSELSQSKEKSRDIFGTSSQKSSNASSNIQSKFGKLGFEKAESEPPLSSGPFKAAESTLGKGSPFDILKKDHNVASEIKASESKLTGTEDATTPLSSNHSSTSSLKDVSEKPELEQSKNEKDVVEEGETDKAIKPAPTTFSSTSSHLSTEGAKDSNVDNNVLSSEEESSSSREPTASAENASKAEEGSSTSSDAENDEEIGEDAENDEEVGEDNVVEPEKSLPQPEKQVSEDEARSGRTPSTQDDLAQKAPQDGPIAKPGEAKEKAPPASKPPAVVEPKKEEVPPLENIQLRVFALLGESENKGTRVEQEMRTVLQTTDAMLKVFRLNARMIEDKVKAHAYDKDTKDYRRVSTAKFITKKAQESRQKVNEALKIAKEMEKSMQSVVNTFRRTEDSIDYCGNVIENIALYEASLETGNDKDRPLEVEGQILQKKLRAKIAKVQGLYDKALQMLLPLGVLGSTGPTRIEKLEEVAFEMTSKSKTLAKEIADLEGEIAKLSLPKLIKDKSESEQEHFSFRSTKWSWAKNTAPTIIQGEL